MQHLGVSGAVRPLKWSLGVKWLKNRNHFTRRVVQQATYFPLQVVELCL